MLQLAAKKVPAMVKDRLFPELRNRQLNLLSKAERERRSERLEAIVLVLLAVLVRCDLLTLRIRWRGMGLTLALISEWTGLKRRRVQRALYDLRYAGYLRGPGAEGPGVIRQPFGRGEPLPAIRELTLLFFDRLGLAPELAKCQAERYERLSRPVPTPSPVIDFLSKRSDRCSVLCYTGAIAARRARAPDSG